MKRPKYIEGEKVHAIQILNSFFYVVVDKAQAKPIGYCGVSKSHELVGLYIDPEYRRQGYSTDLINAFQQQFISLNFTVSEANIPMQELMEKLGYKKWLKFEKVIKNGKNTN